MSNVAAEKVFLAGVARHPQRLFEFVEYLDESDFAHSVTKMTFEAMRSLVIDKEAEKITKAKLVAEAKALGHHNYLSATNNGVWVDELISEEVGEYEVDAHFLEVKRQSLKDQYTESFTELRDYLAATDDPLSVMIGHVENSIISKVNILDKGEHAIEDLREGFEEFINSIADDPGHLGLDLGYPLWQERIGQVRNGAITFMVGTTGCLAGDTLIYDAKKGTYKKIKDLANWIKTGSIASLTKESLVKRKIKDAFFSGKKKVWKLKTQSGLSIDATENHPFWDGKEWVPLENIYKGDYVGIARFLPEPSHPDNDFNKQQMYLLGALFGDGSLTGTSIEFVNFDKYIVKRVRHACEQLLIDFYSDNNDKNRYRLEAKVKMLLRKADLLGSKSIQKYCNDSILSHSNDLLTYFLAGLWDTDGSVDVKGGSTFDITITLGSKIAIYQLQSLLRRFGIVSRVSYKKSICNDKYFHAWRLTLIDRWSAINFIRSIVPHMAHKNKIRRAKRLMRLFERTVHNSNVDTFDAEYIYDIVVDHCHKFKLSIKQYNHCVPNKWSRNRITRSRVLSIGQELNCQKLIDIACGDVFYDRVVSKTYSRTCDVYDLEIGCDHNFVANDFVVHNSGKSQFGMKAAVIAARKGLPVLYLDSELNKQDQWIRIAAMIAKVPSEYVETGFWRMTEQELIDHGVDDPHKRDEIMACGRRLREPRLWEAVKQMPIFYQSISGLSVPDVLPHIRRWLLTHVKPDRETRVPQCLIVYDYIKLAMTKEFASGKMAEWQQHGLHVAALHDFVNKYNVPCIAFGQTNNEIDEGIRCVAGGKRISENVDSVSYFKRKTDAERANDGSGTHMIKVFKARYGKGLWGSYVNFGADLSCGDFTELDIGSVAPPQQDDDNDDDDADE